MIEATEVRVRLALGRVLATPGAIEVLGRAGMTPWQLLRRHARGDWGDLDEEDEQANERALREGERVLSAYAVGDGERVWIITEWDRSATTVLRPEDY